MGALPPPGSRARFCRFLFVMAQCPAALSCPRTRSTLAVAGGRLRWRQVVVVVSSCRRGWMVHAPCRPCRFVDVNTHGCMCVCMCVRMCVLLGVCADVSIEVGVGWECSRARSAGSRVLLCVVKFDLWARSGRRVARCTEQICGTTLARDQDCGQ